MKRVLVVNDHPVQGGIGKYVFHLYKELLNTQHEDYTFSLLFQNVPLKASLGGWSGWGPETSLTNTLSVQYRPWWAKQRGFGKIYQLASLYYFPRKIFKDFSGASLNYVAFSKEASLVCVMNISNILTA